MGHYIVCQHCSELEHIECDAEELEKDNTILRAQVARLTQEREQLRVVIEYAQRRTRSLHDTLKAAWTDYSDSMIRTPAEASILESLRYIFDECQAALAATEQEPQP